jgi:DNA-binding HxlR family transcriptional regulator
MDRSNDATPRSLCPVNLALEVFGDRWTLLVLRDMMYGGRRHFRELLKNQEKISSNILADRLARLVQAGVITRVDDPTHKQKAIYSLTEKGIQLVPVFVQIAAWGRRHLPAAEEFSARAAVLEEGGPRLCQTFMDELRESHQGSRRTRAEGRGRSPTAMMKTAYDNAMARKARRA